LIKRLIFQSRSQYPIHHYRAMLSVSAVFAVGRCPSVTFPLYPDGWRYRQTSFSAR